MIKYKNLWFIHIFLAALVLTMSLACQKNETSVSEVPAPIDPQKVQDQDDMTWNDYNPIPGKNWADPSLHPSDAKAYLNSDVYRLSVSVEGKGWTAKLLNGLAAVEAGDSQSVTVYVFTEESSADQATVTLHAVSESDPSKSANAVVKVSR